MRHIQPRRELEGLRHRFPRVCVLVQGSLGAREGEPGARALGILRDQLLADRKSTRLNSSHLVISYAVFCLKKKKQRNYSENLAHGPAPKRSPDRGNYS